MQILMVVPRLKPAIDGVGDHARLLAGQLRQDYGTETHFVVGDPAWDGPAEVDGFPVGRVAGRTAKALATALQRVEAQTILLHYVGYGYATRGCPIWLADGVERWLRYDSRHHLVTFFHEIFATGPLWSSSFWLSPLQRHLASRLARCSERLLTSRKDYARSLETLSQRTSTDIEMLPVFSTVGEPEMLSRLCDRPRRLVVFGSANSRRQIYQVYAYVLSSACKTLAVEEICDLGVPVGLGLRELDGVRVQEMGICSPQTISHVLRNSIAGVLSFPPPTFLAKSTIFAAYCAHGLLPIHVVASTESVDGLVQNEHYWLADDLLVDLSMTRAQEIADTAHAWYQTHSLRVQGQQFAHHIAQVGINSL